MSPTAADADLAARLRALGDDLASAPAPDVRAAVAARIEDAAPSSAQPRRRPRRRTIAALVATVAISGTAGAAVASPRVREALGDLIRFHGIDISHSDSSGGSGSNGSTAPSPPRLQLGPRVGFAAAQDAVSFRIRQPHGIGTPQSVLLLRASAGSIVTLVYPPGPQLPRSPMTGDGAILTEFAGSIDRVVFHKVLLSIAHTQATTVHGARAIFAGGPQRLFLVENEVTPYGIVPRDSANSLMWAAGGVTYRLEADLPLAAMRALAESVH